jgi:YbgC/YbaW family acyl-CoA thioester hydrolase
MISEYRYQRRVQFAETDQAGIVHFSVFFRYMEEAEHAMWREVGLSVAPKGFEVGWPRVSATCDFQQPLKFEDEFEVRIRVAGMTDKTIRWSCTFMKGDVTIATGSMTSVCVSKRPNEPIKGISIPPEIVSRFKVHTEEV